MDNSENIQDTPKESSQEIIKPVDVTEENIIDGEPTSEKKYSKAEVTDMINRQRTKLVSKNKEANKTSDAELVAAQQERDVLKIALEQAKQVKSSAPNPDDFDDGEYNADFIKKKEAFRKEEVSRLVAEQVAVATNTAQENQRLNSVVSDQAKKTNEHYDRVKDLNVDEYLKREDAAIQIFGQDNVKTIINSFDDSQNLLWYLGTDANHAEAQRIANLFTTNPILGVAEIGGIRQKHDLNSKTKTAPDPDIEIKGDAPTDGDSRLKKQLNKLREEAMVGGDMKALMAFKKLHPGIG